VDARLGETRAEDNQDADADHGGVPRSKAHAWPCAWAAGRPLARWRWCG
jgi:hypothetical protein